MRQENCSRNDSQLVSVLSTLLNESKFWRLLENEMIVVCWRRFVYFIFSDAIFIES